MSLPARIAAANDQAPYRAPSLAQTLADRIIPLAVLGGVLTLAWQAAPAINRYDALANSAPYLNEATWAMWTLVGLTDPVLRIVTLLAPLVVLLRRPVSKSGTDASGFLAVIALLSWSSLGAWTGLAFLNAETRAVACEVAAFFGGECALSQPSAAFIAFATMTCAMAPILGWSLVRDAATLITRRRAGRTA